ncbi:MAG: hypothetical protein V1875_04985 [Candidatus Altiarchaeota archaeon]
MDTSSPISKLSWLAKAPMAFLWGAMTWGLAVASLWVLELLGSGIGRPSDILLVTSPFLATMTLSCLISLNAGRESLRFRTPLKVAGVMLLLWALVSLCILAYGLLMSPLAFALSESRTKSYLGVLGTMAGSALLISVFLLAYPVITSLVSAIVGWLTYLSSERRVRTAALLVLAGLTVADAALFLDHKGCLESDLGCLIERAINEDDPTVCRMSHYSGCYDAVAVAKKNETICEHYRTWEMRYVDECIDKVAAEKKEIRLCMRPGLEWARRDCCFSVLQQMPKGIVLDDEEKRMCRMDKHTCLFTDLDCMVKEALSHDDPHICDDASNLRCYMKVAQAKNDLGICEMIAQNIDRQIKEFAAQTRRQCKSGQEAYCEGQILDNAQSLQSYMTRQIEECRRDTPTSTTSNYQLKNRCVADSDCIIRSNNYGKIRSCRNDDQECLEWEGKIETGPPGHTPYPEVNDTIASCEENVCIIALDCTKCEDLRKRYGYCEVICANPEKCKNGDNWLCEIYMDCACTSKATTSFNQDLPDKYCELGSDCVPGGLGCSQNGKWKECANREWQVEYFQKMCTRHGYYPCGIYKSDQCPLCKCVDHTCLALTNQ